jgi:hypothetical protein
MPLPDSVTACRGQNRMLSQSPRCSAILAQALGRLFLRQKVASRTQLHATQAFGFAVPGGTNSEVGIADLSLGSGNGWLMGAFGATYIQ